MGKEPNNILVIKMLGVGDVVWTTPLLSNLRQGFPKAKISFLCRSFCAPVLANNPDLNEVIPFSSGSRRDQFMFIRELRRRKFDLVIDLFGSPRTAFLSRASGARTRIGFDFGYRRLFYNKVLSAKAANQGHEVEFHLFALKTLRIPVRSKELVFNLRPEETAFKERLWREWGIKAEEKIVGLAATSGCSCRRWPEQNFSVLAQKLSAKKNIRVILFWGLKSELESAQRIAKGSEAKVQIIPKTSLGQMAALLAGCDLVIGNNCGPVQIATAFKVPIINFHGPTRPLGQGPWGVPHVILRNESLSCLECNKTNCPDPKCMTGISVGQTMEAFNRLMPGRLEK
ncbi:glycosyltransferase family 9 protein [candidate division TA06 bacterium]|uniref:Glycosyltransferase family 9 protein n=1 Tax=candidate division TA06 bacterium TaxID=2250710 RepID=A0A933ID84_UNCT6|nr:glycosyltransferase family 9 protein [candidate division TA06 bacterium]